VPVRSLLDGFPADISLTLQGKDSAMVINRAAVLTAASLFLLTGCGGTGRTEPSSRTTGVASIEKPSAAAGTTAAAAAQRPVVRLDASQEERTRLQDAYIDCLLANGFPRQAVQKGPNGGYPLDLEDFDLAPGVSDKIKKNCGPKQPEMAIDRAARLDPGYADHLEANVKCLNEHGLKAVVKDNHPALVDGLPGNSKAHWLDDCEQQAFAGFYSKLK
jgi:hypothetical protein